MGALKTQLKTDLVTAMKAHDDQAKTTIRLALSAIGTEEVAGDEARELTDAEELQVVSKELAKRKDSAEAYTAGGRPELAEKELAEAAFLQTYLPAALSDDEIKTIVDEELAAAEAATGEKPTMRQIGVVMKAVTARTQGRADGKVVSGLVKAALA